ncbi:MAG TPA: ATP-dependent DNA helicase, partial [Castellaniella sp.]|nr:ATP-dependent DNA helicase [Castellaniella sp.]
FSGFRRPGQSWVLTSATLSVQGDFGHFLRQLGLEDAQTCSWTSPFDYPARGLLYVPEGLPWPGDPRFVDAFAQSLLPLIDARMGGVLVLCTTLRAVDRVADVLARHLAAAGRLVMRQGEASRGLLLDKFRQAGNAVLVGSASFWEGIDVPGDALTLVAIDKLPFAPPDDPVIEARLNACRTEGGNPFMEYQLPQAALVLKQGAGRLIRSETDWGVLMVGDGRLVEKPYGKRLWRGLPPFARTRDGDCARLFLASPPPDDSIEPVA